MSKLSKTLPLKSVKLLVFAYPTIPKISYHKPFAFLIVNPSP